MNILDLQTLISIQTEFLEGKHDRTQFTVRYLSFDINGTPSEQMAVFSLTPEAQKEILAGVRDLKKHLSHEEF